MPIVMLRRIVFAAATLMAGCGSSSPPPAPPPVASRPPPPSGPTRTDFRTIAKKLVGRCAAGGWIARWRSEHDDVEVAKPRLAFEGLADDTDEGLDIGYLDSVLEGKMQASGIYDMVSDPAQADFTARGRVARMAERSGGTRIPVYVTTVEIVGAATGKMVRRCEATVEGEMR